MGKIVSGILGGFSGKVANVVGASWKGIDYMKKLPSSVANPRTTPQVNQRSKFKGASEFFSAALSVWVKPLWDRFAQRQSGYNAIIQQNVESFGNDGKPTTTDMVMSKGKMQPPVLSAFGADASTGIINVTAAIPEDFTWGQPDEEVFFLAYNVTQDKIIGSDTMTTSPGSTEVAGFEGSPMAVGDTIWLWSAIKRADGTQVSNSTAIAGTVVP